MGAQNQAEQLIYRIRKFQKEMEGKPEAAGIDQAKVNEALENLEKVQKSENLEEIEAAMKTLEEASHELVQQSYQRMAAAGAGGADGAAGAGPEAGPGPGAAGRDENVVDADFTVVDDDAAKDNPAD